MIKKLATQLIVLSFIFISCYAIDAPKKRNVCRSARVVCYTELIGEPSWANYINSLPGVSWNNGQPSIRNNRASPMYIIDGVRVFMFEFDTNPYNVEYVEVVTDPSRIERRAGFGSTGGLIVIKTKLPFI